MAPSGAKVVHKSFGEFVVGGAIFVGHRRDLAGEAVTETVHAGAIAA